MHTSVRDLCKGGRGAPAGAPEERVLVVTVYRMEEREDLRLEGCCWEEDNALPCMRAEECV